MNSSTDAGRSDAITKLSAVSGSLGGIGLLFVSTLLTQPSIDGHALPVALYCFAVAIPSSVLTFYLLNKFPDRRVYNLPFWLASLSVWGGLACIMWHLNKWASGIYIVFSLGSVIYYFGIDNRQSSSKSASKAQ